MHLTQPVAWKHLAATASKTTTQHRTCDEQNLTEILTAGADVVGEEAGHPHRRLHQFGEELGRVEAQRYGHFTVTLQDAGCEVRYHLQQLRRTRPLVQWRQNLQTNQIVNIPFVQRIL